MKFDVRFAQNDMRICVKLDSDGNGRLRGVTMLMDSAGSTTIT